MAQEMRAYLEFAARWGDRKAKFLLDHGRDFVIAPDTFAGPRMEQGLCYKNAAISALSDDQLLYVEGMVSVHGLPIEHAWNVDLDGTLIDPTIDNDDGRIDDYFGVAFSTRYLLRAISKNGYYGVLGWNARRTLKQLLEGKSKFQPTIRRRKNEQALQK